MAGFFFPQRGLKLNLTGLRFGKLKVLRKYPATGVTHWLCKCECGIETIVVETSLLRDMTRSCGCTKGVFLHGFASTKRPSHPMYSTWEHMKQRCYNPKNEWYHRYGGRGIKVCDKWRYSFLNFYEDCLPLYREGCTIDRIDNEGHYEPGNVRWSTVKEQFDNQYMIRNELGQFQPK